MPATMPAKHQLEQTKTQYVGIINNNKISQVLLANNAQQFDFLHVLVLCSNT